MTSREEDTEFKTQNKDEIKENYNEFKKQVLQDLSGNTLNLIVSHSSFLQKSLKFDKDRKMENLDAYLIIYKKTNDVWNEIPELRRLYLFAENEIIEPNTGNVLIPPVRDKRKLALKNSNNAIERVGLQLLNHVSETSDPNTDKILLVKKSSMGSCKNEEIKIIEAKAMGPSEAARGLVMAPSPAGQSVMARRPGEAAAVLGGGKRRKTRKIRKTKKNKKSKKKRSKKKKSKNKRSKRKNLRATKKE